MSNKRKGKNRASERGQATIEMALALPWIIWLFFYTINAFHQIRTHHVAQKYAAMNLYQRLQHRAKFVVDDQENALHNQTFMAVQYLQPGTGEIPTRKILLGPAEVRNTVGVCREPVGRCAPQ